MSSSRERFEARFARPNENAQAILIDEARWQAWQARDAEVERLVEALREARDLLEDGMWVSADRREDVRDIAEKIDALLLKETL